MQATQRSTLGNALWLPATVFSWTASLATMVGIVAFSLPVTRFVPFEKFQHRGLHQIMGATLWFSLSPLKVKIDPGFDRKRTSVFVQNHVSILDGAIGCGSIPVPLCGLENAGHLNVPGYGWLMRVANAIPVYPKKSGLFHKIAEAFRERAARGISILTFPEAHRTLDGKLRPFKRGIFRIARDSGLPISIVAVRGAFRLLPKGAKCIRPTKIEVYIGPQMETEGLTDDELDELIERTRAMITAWVEDGVMRPELAQPIPPVAKPSVA